VPAGTPYRVELRGGLSRATVDNGLTKLSYARLRRVAQACFREKMELHTLVMTWSSRMIALLFAGQVSQSRRGVLRSLLARIMAHSMARAPHAIQTAQRSTQALVMHTSLLGVVPATTVPPGQFTAVLAASPCQGAHRTRMS